VETRYRAADLATGWTDLQALGLSIGALYDYKDGRVWWFDTHTVEETMEWLLARQPLLVSFSGIGFDFALMRAVVRFQEYGPDDAMTRQTADAVCDAFKVFVASSYDLLAEIWAADPDSKFVRGLNSLDALCQANGLGQKTGTGAEAPRLWQAGRIADVLNYFQHDVYVTKALFELALAQQGRLARADGRTITLCVPEIPEYDTEKRGA
jgi:hypothetical protein